ncbi:DUF1993 family protein [Yoonia sp. 2307UL14-13]|uniref:DUF1993 family protein n=1 Tax=Yoonia sp. 2307UL14-13 TaxID=3126506 RepID=UPI0030A050A6
MFAASVPVALQALDQAQVLLDKTPPTLMSARLAPGMFDLSEQFGIVAGFALRATYPLVGRDVPKLEGDPATRLLRVRILTDDLAEADFIGAAERQITHRAGFADLTQSGEDYLKHFALPNLWFHLSMIYAILRANGVDVGKADFDGLHSYPDGFVFED